MTDDTKDIDNVRINILPFFASLLRDYEYAIQADYYGINVLDRDLQPVYQDGEFRNETYHGPDAGLVYRKRVIELLYWALEHAPTPEVNELGRLVIENLKRTKH